MLLELGNIRIPLVENLLPFGSLLDPAFAGNADHLLSVLVNVALTARVVLEPRRANPAACRRAAHIAFQQANGDTKLFVQNASHMEADCRKVASDALLVYWPPGVVLLPLSELRVKPSNLWSCEVTNILPVWLRIITQFFSTRAVLEAELHIRLAGCNPDLTDPHIVKLVLFLALLATESECERATRVKRGKGDSELTARVDNGVSGYIDAFT